MMEQHGIPAMCLMMTVLPVLVGSLFSSVKKEGARLPFYWVAGQTLLWALFQLVCIPTIFRLESFQAVTERYFLLAKAAAGLAVALGLVKVILLVTRRKAGERLHLPSAGGDSGEKTHPVGRDLKKMWPGLLLWGVFAVLVLIQLFLLYYLAYEEGDDAYYVAITTISKDADKLYNKLPYTGGTSDLNARHALAPFPIWVAVMSWVCGLSGAATAHVGLPLFLVPMTYCLYFLLGEKLIGREKTQESWKLPLYMCLVALLIVFGGYSTYSSENFLLVRSAQGKSVLANVMIPLLLYLLLHLMERMEKKQPMEFWHWILILAVMVAGCLCSTLGSFLLCMFLGVAVFCGCIVYRRFVPLLLAGLGMVIPAMYALFYITM